VSYRGAATACQTRPVLLKVHISDWELEEDGWVLKLGDEVSFWMFLAEADSTSTGEELQELHGQARPLAWEHVAHGRHPVRLDVGPAALYWEAPEPITGDVRIIGAIRHDATEAPPGFPDTRGIVRRIRMEWTSYTKATTGEWRPGASDLTQYVDVATSYFPPDPDSAPSVSLPEATRAAARRIAAALRPSRYTELVVLDDSDDDKTAPGTTRMEWTGVLLDLEILGTATAE
jgi:hypothetical protein